MIYHHRWTIIIIGSAFLLVLAILLDIGPPVRPFLTYWFLFVCPGLAYIRLLTLRHLYTKYTLAIALSLAIDMAVAELMIYTHTWSVSLGLGLIILITLIGVALKFLQQRRWFRPHPETANLAPETAAPPQQPHEAL